MFTKKIIIKLEKYIKLSEMICVTDNSSSIQINVSVELCPFMPLIRPEWKWQETENLQSIELEGS